MLIGAHVSSRGGIDKAVGFGAAIGAEVIQTHPTSAQQWRSLRLDGDVVAAYHANYAKAGMRGHYLHAIYLINLATPKDEHLEQSVASLVHYMEIADALHADGVVVHPGSHLGAGFATMLPRIQAALRSVLGRTSAPARLLIENSAGSGGCVGCSFDEIGAILAGVDDVRMGVCLDTQHMYASGYDVRTAATRAATMAAFDSAIGFERLALVHANDSRKVLGSNVDRHANIGEGEIGATAFAGLLEDAHLRAVPWILEVPGVDRGGPDVAQINVLRGCAGLPPVAPREAQTV